MEKALDTARAYIAAQAEAWLRSDKCAEVPYIALRTQLPFFAFGQWRGTAGALGREAARSLRFAPPLRDITARIQQDVTGGSRMPFNGVHLRLEHDAIAAWLGHTTKEAVWSDHLTCMRSVGFNATTPVYVASGLFSYDTQKGRRRVTDAFVAADVADRVYHKEMFFTDEALAGLHSEQLAAVDFLVLSEARALVGMQTSTFSFYLTQQRAIDGRPLGGAYCDVNVTSPTDHSHEPGQIFETAAKLRYEDDMTPL